MRPLFTASLCLSAVVVSAQVQPSKPSTPSTETKHLVLTTSASDAAAAPGARVSLFVDISPKADMHVYAPEEKNLLPISLRLDAKPGAFTAHAPKFPKSERFTIESLKETQFGYSKPFRIVQEITLGARPAASVVEVTGTLEYQACDKTICYIPVKVPVRWRIGVQATAIQ